jgi:hypothetical protein
MDGHGMPSRRPTWIAVVLAAASLAAALGSAAPRSAPVALAASGVTAPFSR